MGSLTRLRFSERRNSASLSPKKYSRNRSKNSSYLSWPSSARSAARMLSSLAGYPVMKFSIFIQPPSPTPRSIESGVSNNAEIPGVPACIPGSVQGALLEAGIIPDWNVGLDARLCEWVENRHWVYTARLPDEWLEAGKCVRLHALGLDYSGW